MPIYEYACPRCDETSEQVCRMSARDHGPLCGGCEVRMERVPSVTSHTWTKGHGPESDPRLRADRHPQDV